MKTTRGHDVSDIVGLMMQTLSANAYRKHPTKGYLTTISPAYTRERLTKVFGVFGYGWGVTWNPSNTEYGESVTAKGKPRFWFSLSQAEFWYKLVDDNGGVEVISFPVTGYSQNDNIGDAMAGARTSAISAGAKELLFQLHIYKNTKPAPAPAPVPTQMKNVAAESESKAAKKATAPKKKSPAAKKATAAEASPPPATYSEFLIEYAAGSDYYRDNMHVGGAVNKLYPKANMGINFKNYDVDEIMHRLDGYAAKKEEAGK